MEGFFTKTFSINLVASQFSSVNSICCREYTAIKKFKRTVYKIEIEKLYKPDVSIHISYEMNPEKREIVADFLMKNLEKERKLEKRSNKCSWKIILFCKRIEKNDFLR